jgi:hypothetical protein
MIEVIFSIYFSDRKCDKLMMGMACSFLLDLEFMSSEKTLVRVERRVAGGSRSDCRRAPSIAARSTTVLNKRSTGCLPMWRFDEKPSRLWEN